MGKYLIAKRSDEALHTIDSINHEYLRSREVRTLLRISASTLQWLRDTKQIPFYKVGNVFLYSKSEVVAMLQMNKSNPQNA
jgi:hypothetical protein